MKTNRGFTSLTVIVGIVALLLLGGTWVVKTQPPALEVTAETTATTTKDDAVQTEPGDHMEVEHPADEGVAPTTSIIWTFSEAEESDGMPKTKVSVEINGTIYDLGPFTGSCAEIGANGGVDGKGLLAGELSAAQCWYAGGGDEIGVFAHEDGGYQIMVGGLSEGDAEMAPFRGDFSIRFDIRS